MAQIFKGLVCDGEIAVTVIKSTDIVNKAIEYFELSPVAAAALGRMLSISSIMGYELKHEDDNLTVVLNGGGDIGVMTTTASSNGNVKGYVTNPLVESFINEKGKLDVKRAVGTNGKMTIIKNMGLKDPYVGTSEIVSGEIAEDFTAYYALSEQIPTAVALGVRIGKDLKCIGAGGVIVQAMPFASEKALKKAEEIILTITNVSELVETIGAEGIMDKYFSCTEFENFTPQYKCLCSRENTERILASLGKKECMDIINEEGEIKVDCEFCNTVYTFDINDVNKIFN